ncbi:MAG: chemotaxis protein CheB [Gemmatimonadaceae bacterium]
MTGHLVVIGSSWGGLAALTSLLTPLPNDFSAPIVVVQHRSRHADSLLAKLLQDATSLRVFDAEDKEPLEAGNVYLAPANYHLLVETDYLSLTTDPLVRFSRPSIDVTFNSVADSFRAAAIGVVLTGANDDGSRGLRCIIDNGGRGLIQDPSSAESRTMPAAATAAVPEAEVLPLEAIPRRLVAMIASGKSPAKKGTA